MTKNFIAELNEYPLTKQYDFSKKEALDEEGQIMKNKRGLPIMEKDILKTLKKEWKDDLKQQYPTNWKKMSKGLILNPKIRTHQIISGTKVVAEFN